MLIKMHCTYNKSFYDFDIQFKYVGGIKSVFKLVVLPNRYFHSLISFYSIMSIIGVSVDIARP